MSGEKKFPVVSLIGRPNVGKSTLFNRLMKKATKAITYNSPGVTRDRHYGISMLDACPAIAPIEMIVVDTGGFYLDNSKQDGPCPYSSMKRQTQIAIAESDLVLLVVDVREGLMPGDRSIVDLLRKEKRPFWLVINKLDSFKQSGEEFEFSELAVEEGKTFVVSAAHGRGVVNLQEQLHQFLHHLAPGKEGALSKGVSPCYPVVGKLAILGAPNAGKSTLLNLLVGGQRALVSERPGTTVDPIEGHIDIEFGKDVSVADGLEDVCLSDGEIKRHMHQFLEGGDLSRLADESGPGSQALEGTRRGLKIVDTAGIRKKNRVQDYVEVQSVYRALKNISLADIVIYMIDAQKGVSHQDRRLCSLILEKGKSLIVCFNKSDLIADSVQYAPQRKQWFSDLQKDFPWFSFCQLHLISAAKKSGIKGLKKDIRETLILRKRHLSTAKVNQVLGELIERHKVYPKKGRGKALKLKFASMAKNGPPTFLLYCNRSQYIPVEYRRFLQNGLRQAFKLKNTPIHLVFRSGKDSL